MKEKAKYSFITVVCKDEKEKEKIAKMAKKEGRNLSDYCRRKLLGL